MEAIRGLRNVLISKGAKLVPLAEMVEAVTVNTKAKKAIGMASQAALQTHWLCRLTAPYIAYETLLPVQGIGMESCGLQKRVTRVSSFCDYAVWCILQHAG